MASEGDIRPLKIRGKGRPRKSVKGESAQKMMVTVLGTAAAAIFSSVSMLTKQDHWRLEEEEGEHLAKALNEALSTLPEKSYAQVIAIADKWFPWVNLTFVLSAIVVPRLEESAKRVEAKSYQPSQGSPVGDGRSGPADSFNDVTSLGGDFGYSLG